MRVRGRCLIIVEFYADTADRIVIGGRLSLLSIAVFLVFASAMRQVLKDAVALIRTPARTP